MSSEIVLYVGEKGATIAYKTTSDKKPRDLKVLVEIKTGNPVNTQRLIYGGKEMDESKTFDEAGIDTGTEILALYRYPGGVACVLCMNEGSDVVKMECGHSYCPDCIKSVANQQKHAVEIVCLHIVDIVEKKKISCQKPWSFGLWTRAAKLSVKEKNAYSLLLSENAVYKKFPNAMRCPMCSDLVEMKKHENQRTSCSACKKDFCRNCFKAFTQSSGNWCGNAKCVTKDGLTSRTLWLKNEKETITLLKVSGIPATRGCPSCGQLLQHSGENCKHMTCRACDTQFCFVCMRVKGADVSFLSFSLNNGGWGHQCGGAFDPTCKLVPN